MLNKLMDRTKASLFYGIALLLAVAVALMPGTTTFVYMFTPLAAVAIMLFVVTRDGYTKAGLKSLGLHRLGLRAWPAALLVPLLVMGLAYGVVWGAGLATFGTPEFLEGISPILIPLIVIMNIVMASFTRSLGEDLGWRGYLVPRLEFFGAVEDGAP